MSERKSHVYLSIGSNIDRENNIRSCMQALQKQFPDIVFSTIYETPAFGFEGEAFLNLAAGFETDLNVDDIEIYLKNLETQHARQRGAKKFSSRTLDVDLLLYDDLILQPEKDLPRKEITQYAFVLYPLAEIAADFIHPEFKQTIGEMAANSELDQQQLQAIKLT
jgi:2-amino-4-hydroxy-6-hydroxymethyldihydropteridine diphosphokinase